MSAISHELRTPVNIIVSGVELLSQDEDLPEHYKTVVESIQLGSQDILHKLDHLQDLLGLSLGTAYLREEDFNLRDTLQEIVGDSVKLKVEEAVPRVVQSDKSKLRFILSALIQAASSSSRGDLALYVTSNKSHIFFNVSCVEKDLSVTCDETHLIYLARALLTLFQSRLLTTASKRQFAFELPLKPANEPAKTARKLKILLAEDNSVNRMIATRMLERLGHVVSTACNGLEATKESEYDLIVMVSVSAYISSVLITDIITLRIVTCLSSMDTKHPR